jgi:hypothetical protein
MVWSEDCIRSRCGITRSSSCRYLAANLTGELKKMLAEFVVSVSESAFLGLVGVEKVLLYIIWARSQN